MEKINIKIHRSTVCLNFGINRCDINFSYYVIWIHITVITCTANDFWRVKLSPLMSYETSIFSLIQTLESGSIIFGKIISVFDELPNYRVEKIAARLSFNKINAWSFQIVWLVSVDMWYNGIPSPPLILW